MGIYNIFGTEISGASVPGNINAAGDGVTDDTEALTKALNQSNAVVDGGNKKYKYMSITMTGVENLTVKNVIFWKGQTLEVAGCKNIRFENCTWEGINCNGNNTIWTCGIRLRERKDENGNEIWCENIWIENCIFNDIWYNTLLDHSMPHSVSGQAIVPRSVHNLYIRHNFFTQTKGNAAIHWNTYKKCGYAEITDNTFYLTGVGGICVYAVQQAFPKVRGKLSNNQFIGCGLGYMPPEFLNKFPENQRGLGCAAILGGAGTKACPYKWHFVCENNTFEDCVESSIEGPVWNPCIGNSITGQGAIQTDENCRKMEEKYHLDYTLQKRIINSVNFIYRNYYKDVDGSFPNEDNDPIVFQNNTMGIAYVPRASYIQFKGEYNVPFIFTNNTMRTGLTQGLDTHFLNCQFKAGIRFENNDGIYPYFNSCTFAGDVVLDDMLSAYKCNWDKANLITNQSRGRFPETHFSIYDPSRAILENDQAVVENGLVTLSAHDLSTSEDSTSTQNPVPIYNISTDSHYSSDEEAVVFDGTFGIDTGIELFSSSSDFTVIARFELENYHDAGLTNFNFVPVLSSMNYAEDKKKSPGFDVGLSLQGGAGGNDLDAVPTGGFLTIRNSWKYSNSFIIENSYFGYHGHDYGVIIIRKNNVLSFYDFNMQKIATINDADATTIFSGTLHIGENMVAPTLAGNNKLKGKVYDCRVYSEALSISILEEMFPNIYSNEERTKGSLCCYVPNQRYKNALIRYIYLEALIDMGEHGTPEYAQKYPKAVGIKIDGIGDVIWVGTGSNGHIKTWIYNNKTIKPYRNIVVRIVNTGLCPGLKAKVQAFRCAILTEESDVTESVDALDFSVEWDKTDLNLSVGETLTGYVSYLPEDSNSGTTLELSTSEGITATLEENLLTVTGVAEGEATLEATLPSGIQKIYTFQISGA